MDKVHKDTLRKNRVTFVNDLIVDDVLLAYLAAKEILTRGMCEEIESKPTNSKKVSKLLDDLPRRGPKSYQVFYEALLESGQPHLAEILYPEGTAPQTSSGGQAQPGSQPVEEEEEEDLPPVWPDPEFGLDFKIRNVESDYQRGLAKKKDVYPNTSAVRGRCIIINNQYFKTLANRTGTDQDATKLELLFKAFKYTVITIPDLDSEGIKNLVDEERQRKDHGDSFVFIILSHGLKGGVYGVDDKVVSIDSIQEAFDGNNCKALLGKPKMFFIQACQGKDMDPGASGDSADSVNEAEQDLKSLHLKDEEVSDSSGIPVKADQLVAKATVPDFVSWRNVTSGTWFIQALVYVFARFAYKDDVQSMMTKVNNLVAKAETATSKKQISILETTLRRKIYFFPGM